MAQTWLIPIDGSDTALKVIDWLLDHLNDLKEAPKIHLLNVQASLPRDISRFISSEQLRDYHRTEGLTALSAATQLLKDAGLEPEMHVSVGHAAETIIEFAEQLSCNQILIGTRGHTGLGGSLLGSVASKVAHLTHIPLLLIR